MIDGREIIFKQNIKTLEDLQNKILLTTSEEEKNKILEELELAKQKTITSEKITLKQLHKLIEEKQKMIEEHFKQRISELQNQKNSTQDEKEKQKIEFEIEKYTTVIESKKVELDDISVKYQAKLLNEVEKFNIYAKDLRENPEEELEVEKERKEPHTIVNVNTGMYTMTDAKGQKYERKINKRLITEEAKYKFAQEVLKKYVMQLMDDKLEEFAFEKELEKYILEGPYKKTSRAQIKQEYLNENRDEIADEAFNNYKKYEESFINIAENADINYYLLCDKYDKENKTNYSERYLQAISTKSKDFMPTTLTYEISNEKIKGTKDIKKYLTEIAHKQEGIGIVEIDQEPKISIWQKIANFLNKKKQLALPESIEIPEENMEHLKVTDDQLIQNDEKSKSPEQSEIEKKGHDEEQL